MLSTRGGPWGLMDLRNEMDRLVQRFGGWQERPFRTRAFPAVNVWQEGERVFVETELPGVDNEDITLQVVGDELTIKGRRDPLEGKDLTYHRQERGVGEFTRLIHLPVDVNADKVEAVMKNGVLTVIMPWAEAAKAKRVKVKTA